jgi:hypothetical protein
VVAETVNAIYRRDGLPLTDVALTIRPTNLNADTALDGLRRLGRSAADLMARLPRDPFSDTPRALPRATVREGSGEASSFDEVGGQEEAKRELQAICLAIKEPEAYRRWGARPPKGVLMYGPPGTGKTLLARCLAAESGANFVHVRATDVASKWYGEAERRLQSVFDQARRQAPAVLFFDEIDALARHREESHEATHRVVSTLLENMDGLEESKGIVVIAATNRPPGRAGALRADRPGRLGAAPGRQRGLQRGGDRGDGAPRPGGQGTGAGPGGADHPAGAAGPGGHRRPALVGRPKTHVRGRPGAARRPAGAPPAPLPKT